MSRSNLSQTAFLILHRSLRQGLDRKSHSILIIFYSISGKIILLKLDEIRIGIQVI